MSVCITVSGNCWRLHEDGGSGGKTNEYSPQESSNSKYTVCDIILTAGLVVRSLDPDCAALFLKRILFRLTMLHAGHLEAWTLSISSAAFLMGDPSANEGRARTILSLS